MITLIGALTVAAAVGSGLMAGVFFIFSTTIMPALRKQPVAQGVAVMQRINVVIVQPLFLLLFMGTGVVSVAMVVVAPDPLRIAGAALYLVGSIGVTAVVNVPLNNMLNAAEPLRADAQWERYLVRWVPWNHVRAVASFAAAVLLTVAA